MSGWMRLLARWRVAVVILTVLLITGTIHFTSVPRLRLTLIEEVFRDILAPVQTGFTRAHRTAETLFTNVREFSSLRDKNEKLQGLVLELQQQVVQLAEYERENQWLREALDFKQEVSHELLVSEVIGRSPTNWLSTITINRGRDHGVQRGMAVVSGTGIVGTVDTVSARTASVIMSTDPLSAVGGLVQSSGDLVLVEGDSHYSGMLMARPLARDVELTEGDLLVTSGLSHLFPKGLPIGTVTQVVPSRYDLTFTAYVEPLVDFTRLEYVFVVLSRQTE